MKLKSQENTGKWIGNGDVLDGKTGKGLNPFPNGTRDGKGLNQFWHEILTLDMNISRCLEASNQQKSFPAQLYHWNWSDSQGNTTNGVLPSPLHPQPPTTAPGTSPNLRKGSTRRPCQQRGELTPDPGPGFVVFESATPGSPNKQIWMDENDWPTMSQVKICFETTMKKMAVSGSTLFLLEKRTLQSNCHWFPASLKSKVWIIWYQQVLNASCVAFLFLHGPFFSGPAGRVRRTFLGTGQVQGTASPGCWF